jgi:hypothetical protein
MSDITVRIGNTAPTSSTRRAASEEEAAAAGPLGSKEINPADGSETHFVLEQQPTGADKAITTFVIPHSASIVDAVKDIGLAFTRQHSLAAPAWVHSDHDVARSLVANHLGSLHGVDVPEFTHEDLDFFMGVGMPVETAEQPADGEPSEQPPPAEGEGPADAEGQPPIAGGAIQAVGRDLWAQALADLTGVAGTATGSSATTLTDTTKSWTSNQWVGKDIYAGAVVGTITGNTATAVTVARWETPGSRSGATASTPSSTAAYSIASGQAPAAWVALTANTGSPTTGGSDTTLTGEIATSGGGLVRAVAVYGHTTGTNTYTLTNTFTANGTDVLPVVVAKVGVFQSQTGGRLLFETLLGSTATLNNPGDNVQITDTITGT